MTASRARPALLDWAGLVVVALTGALAALVEALLVPLYAGSTIVPVALALALAGNVLLPRLARTLVPTTPAAVAPVLAWLVVMIFFGVVARPEGDVVLPGSPTAVEWVTYGVLLGGALAGTLTVVLSTPPPARREAPAS